MTWKGLRPTFDQQWNNNLLNEPFSGPIYLTDWPLKTKKTGSDCRELFI